MSDYTPQSSLRSVGRIGQARWATALAKRIPRAEAESISEMYHTEAPILGLNPDLALAQACEETGRFTSARWRQQRNPCGLGITSDDTPGVVFPNARLGILAHIQHLCCYAYTEDDCPVMRVAMIDFRHHFHDGDPALSHLQDDRRQWATKPGYVARILAIANAVLASPQPPSATEGATMPPKPPMQLVPSPNRGYNNGHIHRPEALLWHITQGTNSLGWLTNPQSGASSNYLIARVGTIYELVKPTASAWANGQVNKPNTLNPLIVKWRAEGCNFNQRTISIEHEGFTSNGEGGSLTAKQIDATVRLSAWLCAEFGIAVDRRHIFGHFEIDSVDRPNCPGFSEAEWATWVAGVAALVAGPAPAPIVVPSPVLTEGQDWGGAGRIVSEEVTAVNDLTGVYYSRKKRHDAAGVVMEAWREV